jgi:hypothetical protein
VQRKTCYDVTPSNAKEAKSFDAWFYSLTKKEQDKLRDGGVLPYKEMWKPSRVFEIKENHNAWSSDNVLDHRTETDNFVTRECVGQLLKSFIDALAFTNNYSFRRHVELVRWALELPGRMPSRNLADMYGLSHEWVQKRARKIREAVNVSDMLILEPYTDAELREIIKHNKKPMNKGSKPPIKESPKHPPTSGVA